MARSGVNFKSFDTKDTKDTKEISTKVPENQPQSLDTEDTEENYMKTGISKNLSDRLTPKA